MLARSCRGTWEPFVPLVAWLQDHLSRVPREGDLAGGDVAGDGGHWEIVSAVGINEYLRSYHIPFILHWTAPLPSCPLKALDRWGFFDA